MNTDEDLNVMWSIFYSYASKGLIKVDVNIARSANDIINMLQRPVLNYPFITICNVKFILTTIYATLSILI